MSTEKYLAVDTETGGFSEKTDALLSSAFVVFNEQFEIVDKRFAYFLPLPHKRVIESAAKVNGYSKERWLENGAVPLSVGFSAVSTWLRQFGSFNVLAHNAQFDQRFLLEAQVDAKVDLSLPRMWICTKEVFKVWGRENNYEGGHRLDDLCRLMNHPRSEEHDSFEDAIICGKGYGWLLKNKTPPLTFQEALQFVCPFGKHKGKPLGQIALIDRQWLRWLSKQSWVTGKLREAILLITGVKNGMSSVAKSNVSSSQ
jgi:DNA polymerase III epsilon subunit-like protein